VLPDIKSLTREELDRQFKAWNEPAFRVAQLLDWLYVRRATEWDAMSNLPKALRGKLRENFSLKILELVRQQGTPDTTRKFLWRLADGQFIESVLIPANAALYGEASDRHTLCISTQVGCAYGCKFCASGLNGLKRNLEPHEIIEQVLAVERWHEKEPRSTPPAEPGPEAPQPKSKPDAPRLINNLVIMGMGEPLANYENLIQALKILNAPWGGLAPQIRRLAHEPFQFRLAISLHGATDTVRDRIMPVNKKYPLRELAAACDDYQKLKGRMITLEYILIAGVNDALAQTYPLAALAKRFYAKVNLIPYNPVEGLPWQRPSEEVCAGFLAALEKQDVTATLRQEKGRDIDAACGQLRLKTEQELEAQLKTEAAE